MSRRIVSALAAVLAGSVALMGQSTGQSMEARVDALSAAVASSSISVRSAALDQQAEAEGILADCRLPDPTVELEHLWGAAGATKLTASVSQEVEWPAVYSRRRQAAASVMRASAYLQRQEWLSCALEAKQLVLDHLYTRRCIAVLEHMDADIDTMQQLITAARRGGELTQLDLRKAAIERASVASRLAELRASLTDIEGQLCALAGSDSDEARARMRRDLAQITDYPAPALLPLARYLEQCDSLDPTVRHNSLQAVARRQMERAVSAERGPRLGLGYVLNREEGLSYNGLTLTASLPIYSDAHRRAALTAQARQLDDAAAAASVAARASVAALYSRVVAERQQAQAMSEAVNPTGQARSSFELLRLAYTSGYISMLDYLTEAAYFLQAELDLQQSLHALALSQARLGRLSLLGAMP